MANSPQNIANRLLEQHVKYELASLKGARLSKFLRQELHALLDQAQGITLNRFTSVEQVMGVVQRLVVEMELSAQLPELVSELTDGVLAAPVQDTTRLADILSQDQVLSLVDEALQFRQQRERMISELMAHPVYQELVSNLVYAGLVSYLYEDNLIAKSVPGVGSMMKFGKRMANKAVPGLDETFERRIKSWLADSLPGLIARSEQFLHKSLTDEELRNSALAVWDALEQRTLGELRDGLGEVDAQRYVEFGYEFWLQFRATGYFKGCVRAVVEQLFARYGERPVTDFLDDLGVTRELIETELEACVVPVIDVLREAGYVEALLRRRLSGFYQSAAARKILDPVS